MRNAKCQTPNPSISWFAIIELIIIFKAWPSNILNNVVGFNRWTNKENGLIEFWPSQRQGKIIIMSFLRQTQCYRYFLLLYEIDRRRFTEHTFCAPCVSHSFRFIIINDKKHEINYLLKKSTFLNERISNSWFLFSLPID